MDKQSVKFKRKRGFITLLLVLITGSIGITVAISVIISGLGSSRTSLSLNFSDQAKALVDACAERGLEAIRDNASASGSNNLNLGTGSCSYTITIQSGENRLVEAVGSIGNTIRKVRIYVNAIKPKINVVSWQEVD